VTDAEALDLCANAADDLARLGDKVGQPDVEGLREAARAARTLRGRLKQEEGFLEAAMALYWKMEHPHWCGTIDARLVAEGRALQATSKTRCRCGHARKDHVDAAGNPLGDYCKRCGCAIFEVGKPS